MGSSPIHGARPLLPLQENEATRQSSEVKTKQVLSELFALKSRLAEIEANRRREAKHGN
jgi:hypothetical protein